MKYCYSQLISTQNQNKFEIQPYLIFSISKKICSLFFNQLRINSHKLQIEVGGYCNPFIQRDERYFIYCHTVVEDQHQRTVNANPRFPPTFYFGISVRYLKQIYLLKSLMKSLLIYIKLKFVDLTF